MTNNKDLIERMRTIVSRLDEKTLCPACENQFINEDYIFTAGTITAAITAFSAAECDNAEAVEAEREACVKVAGLSSMNKNSIHPDLTWEQLSESTRMVVHTTCQQVAAAIRSRTHGAKSA